MSRLTWEQVLKRTDLIGGDIETVEGGVVFRGPLSEIKVKGTQITFISPWCARYNRQTQKWENWPITTSGIATTMVQPQGISDGRIHFIVPFLGSCTLIPRGGSKLSRSKVEGLT